MVWELTPLNSSAGSAKYYMISQGIYKVGRKDCDVTIQTDKTISRVHAEILADPVISQSTFQPPPFLTHPQIRLKDLSKFGTFVNKQTGSKPVLASESKETDLKPGDLITFGTNNTTYRLSFLLFVFYIPTLGNLRNKQDLCEAISSMGAYLTDKWRPECTHLVVEDGSTVTNDVIDAIVLKKHVVMLEWLQAIAGQKSLLSEIPSCSSFTPTLMLNCKQASVSVKIRDSAHSESCLSGITFYLGPLDLYYYKNKLQSLLAAAGPNVVVMTKKSSVVQRTDTTRNHEFLVVPDGNKNKEMGLDSDQISYLKNIPSVAEIEAVKAAMSGFFDTSVSTFPLCLSSSSSTREFCDIADSDDEPEVSKLPEQSQCINNISSSDKCTPAVQGEYKVKMNNIKPISGVNASGFLSLSKRTIREGKRQSSQHVLKVSASEGLSDGSQRPQLLRHGNNKSLELSDEYNSKDHEKVEAESALETIDNPKFDVLHVPNLIVKEYQSGKPAHSSSTNVRNFKRFSKRAAVSGNSFSELIPFAKDPYKESDYGREMAEYMKEEKKRKDAEALADSLFNAEQLKRKRAARRT